MNVVITGSSRGIGFGMAKEFLKNGHKVLINSTSVEKLNIATEKLKEYSENIARLVLSVNEPNFVDRAFDIMNERFGGVDIWLNNAGISQPYFNVHEISDEIIENILKTNLITVANITKKVYSKMNAVRGGKIFNMEGFGSDGRMGHKMTIYGTSKRALTYFTESFAKEVGGKKVQICRMSPGMVITDFIVSPMEHANEKEIKQFHSIFNILGSKVDEVAHFLYKGIMRSKKNNDSINFLTTPKILFRFVRHLFSPRNYFENK
ncbi:MAG: SDR family oxidoreductase [Bacteroidales bacterium]|nr:SDR family oxidoreductase [Bacteroidales bacterium]